MDNDSTKTCDCGRVKLQVQRLAVNRLAIVAVQRYVIILHDNTEIHLMDPDVSCKD